MSDREFEAVKLIAQLIGAAFVAWLTVTLALRRFKKEKSWERQIEAYLGIIRSLSDLRSVNVQELREMEMHADLSDDERAEQSRIYKEAQSKLNDYISIGAIVLPMKEVVELRGIFQEIQKSRNYEDRYTDTDNEVGIIDKHIARMVRYGQAAVGRGHL